MKVCDLNQFDLLEDYLKQDIYLLFLNNYFKQLSLIHSTKLVLS